MTDLTSNTMTASPNMSTTQRLLELLSQTSSYPERPASVTMIETHISWVFLTSRYAYKLKKPVRFEFLDFSTPERRHEFCELEIELNRRLAPDVYLGVVPITETASRGVTIDGDGLAVDWLVRMRRLPADRSLDKLIQSGALTDREIGQIGHALADFYSAAPPVSLRTDSYHQQIEHHVDANRSELLDPIHGLDARMIERVHSAQLNMLRLNPEVFHNRVRDGRIVEGHGDLRPEHIYLNPAPIIIDCIEFNAELRQLDVLDELSFLAIECAYLGANEIGGQILDDYCRASGDQPPPELLSFYMCYRASVRAKVHALRARQLPAQEQASSLDAARKYLALADHYAAELGPPRLIIVRGLTGTGKSTLATALAQSLGVELLQTDKIRLDLFGPSQQPAQFDEDHYRTENRLAVYDEMFDRAGRVLGDGMSVVLDGTFLTTKLRARALLLARHHEAVPVLIECQCPDSFAAERIAHRLASTAQPSESRSEFVGRQRAQEQADPPGITAYQLPTTASLPVMLEAVYAHLKSM